MTRVVGVYGLVLVCVYAVLTLGITTVANRIHAPMITYIAHYYDAQFASNDITVVRLLDTLTFKSDNLLASHEDLYDQSWSPDGHLLAVSREGDRVSNSIRILDEYGNEVAAVYSDLGDAVNPNWMPDSTHIVFSFYNGFDVEIYEADVRTLTHGQTNWQSIYHLPDFFIQTLDVSPDGQQFIISGGNEGTQLYITQIGDEQLNLLSEQHYGVSWSPDGQQIVFNIANPDMNNSELYVMNLDDRRVQRLTNTSSNEWEPTWSPDGTQIAFVSDRDGDNEIFVMNTDGTNLRQVTFNDVDDSDPAWMP